MKLRASSLNIAAQCPLYCAEALEGNLPKDETKSEVSTIGTAVHAALEEKAKTNEMVSLDEIAVKYGIGIKQLSYLFFSGLNRLDSYLSQEFEIIASEQELENELITGHCDLVMSHPGGNSIVLDWKTGNVSDCYPQLMGYAMLAGEQHQLTGDIYIVGEFLREQESITSKTTVVEARKYIENVLNSADKNKACISSHCTYCPLKNKCSVYADSITAAGRDLIAISGCEITTPLPDLYEQSKLLRKALDDYDKALKAMIENAGGILERADGKVFSYKISETKKFNLSEKASEIINSYSHTATLTDLLVRNVEFSKSTLNKIPANQFNGGKGKAITAIMSELEEAGLVEKGKRNTLQLI